MPPYGQMISVLPKSALLLYMSVSFLSSKNSTFFGHTVLGGIKLRVLKSSILFYIGGSAYMVLEFLWRGRSHGSMFLLGGLCFLLIGKLNHLLRRIPLALQLIASAVMITVLELGTGLLVNRDYSVWDYRTVSYNFLGQICLPFSLLWIPVSLLGMQLYHRAERLIAK